MVYWRDGEIAAAICVGVYFLNKIANTLEAIRFMIFTKLERDGFFGRD